MLKLQKQSCTFEQTQIQVTKLNDFSEKGTRSCWMSERSE